MSKRGSVTNSGPKFVEICDLVFEYVRQFPFAKDVRSRINLEELKPSDIDFTYLRILNKETCHIPTNADKNFQACNGEITVKPEMISFNSRCIKKSLKSHILFSSVFTNNTNEPQTNHLRTERRTNSMCRLSVQKAVTKEGGLSLQIGPPSVTLQATGGFRREVTMSREFERVIEEELVWSLDTEVIVPPGHCTRADLVITEDEYDGRFQVETQFGGKITIKLRDKKDGSLVTTVVINDLTRVLTPKYGFRPVEQEPGMVSYINEGTCHCHFGIGQRVDLNEEKI